MKVISIEEDAFYALINKVYDHINEQEKKLVSPWVSPEKAMEILHIKSKTTLQKLRDKGDIIYTQPQKKIILYHFDSLLAYLDKYKSK